MRKSTLFVLTILCLASYSAASFRDKRTGVAPKPELSQAEVAKQQLLQKVQPEVGAVERPVQQSLSAPVDVDPLGKNILHLAPRAGMYDPHNPAAVLERATKDEQEAIHKSHRIVWEILLTLACFGAGFAAFRRWVNKAIPFRQEQEAEFKLNLAPHEKMF